jgi:hypothetical protein
MIWVHFVPSGYGWVVALAATVSRWWRSQLRWHTTAVAAITSCAAASRWASIVGDALFDDADVSIKLGRVGPDRGRIFATDQSGIDVASHRILLPTQLIQHGATLAAGRWDGRPRPS